MTRNNNTESHLEFLSPTTETNDKNSTHTDSKDEAPRQQTRSYKDAMNSPERKHWRDSMDYKLTKLEEVNTWSKINETNVPQGAQILLGMWVHLVKNLEAGEQKFR